MQQEETSMIEHERKTVNQEMADLFNDYGRKPEVPWLYRIWDTKQKYLLLQNGTLVAAPQNSNSEDQLITVAPNRVIDSSKRPIFMGTKVQNYVLTVKSGDRPQLQLVAGDVKDLHEKKEESKEFTFYNQTKGSETTCSFESAISPGWFLSTSAEPHKPLGLSQGGGSDITIFYFVRKQ
ncbi:interleukin-1 family member 10-like isoform X1 [Sphaerodactylus townsendi]|uniref:interleukin-1 family member 10-like isoform X1 n=1 Tax=Sphaerodactylus townsendi TaxID=933632 RepID=UPI00202614F5|nr:interleukin-1 family member 10-like isoform X1 [Sphaerodactylus townsendi]